MGAALAAFGLVDASSAPETLRPLAEITLVWVLFSDAARLPVQELRRDLGRYARLLGIALPLTIVFGWALAAWLFPRVPVPGWPSSLGPPWLPPMRRSASPS